MPGFQDGIAVVVGLKENNANHAALLVVSAAALTAVDTATVAFLARRKDTTSTLLSAWPFSLLLARSATASQTLDVRVAAAGVDDRRSSQRTRCRWTPYAVRVPVGEAAGVQAGAR
eukprot:m51a1_g6589 hypothetical protein (116) ;mRNA; r:243588-245377